MLKHLSVRNPVIVTSVGATIEWMEYSAYLYLVPTLRQLFLPDADAVTGTMFMFWLVFATNLARPLGGFVFGFVCDRYGRKLGLMMSIALMTCSTTGIGLLPTYADIGIAAPLLLMLFRFMQGLAMAGEFTNAAMFMIEHRPDNPYLAGSWANWGGNLGIAGGALLTAVVTLPGMPEWGWRIPFLVCCASAILVIIMRSHLQESPVYDEAKAKKLAMFPVLKTLARYHKIPCLKLICLASLMGVTTYVANMYWNTFVVTRGYFSASTASSIVGIDAGIEFLFLPLMAMLAYKTNARKVMFCGLLVQMIASTANFSFAELGNVWVSVAGMLVMALGICAFEAPIFKTVFDLFPVEFRCTAVAFTWGLSQCLISAPALALAEWLGQFFAWQGGPICIITLSIVGGSALYYSRQKQSNQLSEYEQTELYQG